MIGFIGLGVMGTPICRNLAAKSGDKVCAFDIDAARLEKLKQHGVKAAQSAREVAEHAEVLFLSLPGGKEVKEVCVGRESLLRFLRSGSYLVDLSTVPVALAVDLHGRFAARGVHFADAPVARTRAAAESGTLSLMVGAPESTFKRIRPLLAHIGTDITHCGGPGSGQAMKLVNNMVLFQNVAALAEALALARRAGLDAAKLFEVLAKGSADSFALRNHGMKSMLPGEYPQRAFPVEYAIRDLDYALELAQQAGIKLHGALYAKALLERAAAAGFGKEYFPALAKVL